MELFKSFKMTTGCKSLLFLITLCTVNSLARSAEVNADQELYNIEGEVITPDFLSFSKRGEWLRNTVVYIKGGAYVGFIRKNGSFVIPNVPSGSYIVEMAAGNYLYEPIRVEITSKGKTRARKINYLQASQVITIPYPLKFKSIGVARYFQMREQLRLSDLLLNPMVLMMVLPLICIMLLPKVMNDPETKKDMEQFQSLTNKYDIPEMSEMITSYFSGGSSDKQGTRSSASTSAKRKSVKSN